MANFSADKRRHNELKTAFHEVKCGSEHSNQIKKMIQRTSQLSLQNRNEEIFCSRSVFPQKLKMFPLRVPAKAKNVPASMASLRHVPAVPAVPAEK